MTGTEFPATLAARGEPDPRESADRLLRDKNAFNVLVAVYADAWPKIPRPRPAAYSQYTPWVIIGKMYAQALDDAGKPNEARNVRSLSDSVHTDR